MDVRIGVLHTPKEIDIEVNDDDIDREELMQRIEMALADDRGVLWLTDRKGDRFGVPASRVAYIEIGGRADRRVGFGAP